MVWEDPAIPGAAGPSVLAVPERPRHSPGKDSLSRRWQQLFGAGAAFPARF